jgi:hypothetical protein
MDIIKLYDQHSWDITKKYYSLRHILQQCGEAPEGNCFYYHESLEEFKELQSKRSNILFYAKGKNKICEIGFNAGHSAVLLFESSAKDANILFFDLGNHSYMKPCYEYVKGEYTQSSALIVGDSRETFSAYLSDHPEEVGTYELVHVDGGHEESVFLSDIKNAMKLVKKGGIVIVDDTQIPYIRKWIDESEKDGSISVLEHQLPTFGYEHCIIQKKTAIIT